MVIPRNVKANHNHVPTKCVRIESDLLQMVYLFLDNILSMPEASSLPTLPFTALISLLNNTLLATDDGVVLRKMCLETGSIHLILACLAVLSHQSPMKGESNLFTEVVPQHQPLIIVVITNSINSRP